MSTEFIPNNKKISESQFNLSFKKKSQIHKCSYINKNYVIPDQQ